jgi:hypothetical protein
MRSGGVVRSIGAGFRAARKNLVAAVWIYLASMLSAFPIAVSLAFVVDAAYGKSLAAPAFAERLDPELAVELAMSQADALLPYLPLVAGAMLFFGALSAFLTGAVLMAVSSDEPPRTGDFFSAGGRVLGRMLRLVLFGLPFSALVAGLAGVGAFRLATHVSEDWVSEKGVVAVRVAAAIVTGLVLAWVNGAYDFMKVEAVAKGEHRARYAFVRGLERAFFHPLDLFGVFLPFVLLAIAVTVLASLADVAIARSSWIAIALGVLLQQATAFLRAILRIGVAGAEVAYIRGGR